jgi:hypothetical protein
MAEILILCMLGLVVTAAIFLWIGLNEGEKSLREYDRWKAEHDREMGQS